MRDGWRHPGTRRLDVCHQPGLPDPWQRGEGGGAAQGGGARAGAEMPVSAGRPTQPASLQENPTGQRTHHDALLPRPRSGVALLLQAVQLAARMVPVAHEQQFCVLLQLQRRLLRLHWRLLAKSPAVHLHPSPNTGSDVLA